MQLERLVSVISRDVNIAVESKIISPDFHVDNKNTYVHSKPIGYWGKKENVHKFLSEIKKKYNLNTPEDWNSITQKQIRSNGGSSLLAKFSMFTLKKMACPEGKLIFKNHPRPSGYWENKENIQKFLLEIKEKYNLQSPEDWNLITTNQIQSNGGWMLLKKYSMYDIKCIACPEGKSIFNNQHKPSGYWENNENVRKFLCELKEKYNLQTPEDWNLVTQKQIKNSGGRGILGKYSMYDIKCMACPEGKSLFNDQNKPSGYWENNENIQKFLWQLKEKYNLQTPEDWNLITQKQIQLNGGGRLFHKYSIYDIKCMGCPEGKSLFNNQHKPSNYWENENNVMQFLFELKEKYNLNTSEDWNSITTKHIKSNGGSGLLIKYSLFELKCLANPEGKSIYTNPKESKPFGYWENEININHFFEKLKLKYHLKTPLDWNRLSVKQIISQGGSWLFKGNKDHLKIKINFEGPNNEIITKFLPLKELISCSIRKRSSQRWLFLQIQNLFPGEEIVEDYFHSDISRESGFAVQFDIFMIQRKIAIEYHGQQHYEDISSGFSSLEMYKNRDLEKLKLCDKYGIKLIVIPYWWDNKIESLKKTLQTEIK